MKIADLVDRTLKIRDAMIQAGITSNEIIAAAIVVDALADLEKELERTTRQLDFIGDRIDSK